ncbi:MAG TPA: hypothetical protein VEC14_07085 [Reyranellaceae bacterium]|nr:hypothetical protein [Reyranellaceae bacterium]
MRLRALFALLALALPAAAIAAVGGAQYQPQYDFDELRAATHNKPMRVEIFGNPFPGMATDDAARQMLPLIQAARPQRLRTIFTYDKSGERPDYRLVLVFDSANNLNSATVCNGEARHQPGKPGRVEVFAVYCRNDQVMSETTAWTDAGGPTDPRLGRMFFDTLSTVFSDAQGLKPHHGLDRR